MLLNNKLISLVLHIIAIFVLSTSMVTSAQAKQQNVFLDAAGNPIPNDILLSLSSKKPSNKSKSISLPPIEDKKSKPNKKSVPKKTYQSNPELEKELFYALQAGQTQRVNQLLKSGIRPVYKNYKGETPLGIAVTRGWASMVISLLENGADIKEEGTRGVTLLHTASSRGMTDVAKTLVKHGLNPNKKTDKNWTPLHVAARYGHWQLVQYYIQAGVDPDIRNSDGKTALGLARHLRHMGVVKILSQVTTVRSLDSRLMKKSRKKVKKRTKKRRT